MTASTNRPNASKTRPRPISCHRLRLVARRAGRGTHIFEPVNYATGLQRCWHRGYRMAATKFQPLPRVVSTPWCERGDGCTLTRPPATERPVISGRWATRRKRTSFSGKVPTKSGTDKSYTRNTLRNKGIGALSVSLHIRFPYIRLAGAADGGERHQLQARARGRTGAVLSRVDGGTTDGTGVRPRDRSPSVNRAASRRVRRCRQPLRQRPF